jgi:prevent-host-death family protein
MLVTMGRLREALSELLTEVAARGAKLIVTRNGKRIAVIISVAECQRMAEALEVMAHRLTSFPVGAPKESDLAMECLRLAGQFRVVSRTDVGSLVSSGPPDATSSVSSGIPRS